MAIHTQEIFLLYDCNPEPCTLFQSPSSSSPSPPKISIQFSQQTFTFTFDDSQDSSYRIPEEADDRSMEPLCICVAAEEVDGDDGEFYLLVYETLERLRIPEEGLQGLAVSIIEAIREVKRSEINSHPNFKELIMNVFVTVANVVTVSDTSTAVENAMRESMEDYEDVNYGMMPTSKKAQKRMLKSIVVAGEKTSPGKDRPSERERKKMCCESVKEETCTICLENIPAGSTEAQLPCSHVFHNTCINEWLGISHFCPIRRFEFPAD